MQKKLNVLMLVSTVDTNRLGADGFIADWIRVLSKRVNRLVVLAYNYSGQEKLPSNTTVQIISGNNFLTRNFDLLRKIFLLTGKEKINVILPHILEIFAVIGGVCGRLLNVKTYFWYCQGYNLSKHLAAKAAFWATQYVLTCSLETKKRYVREIGRWVGDKIIPVGHGIYLPHYLSGSKVFWPESNSQPIKILYAGRVTPIKDVPTLQRAVELLKSRKINVSLEINGSYSYSVNQKVFKMANILVVPTLSRSLDKVFLEGLVCDVVTIGTDVGYPFMKDKFPQLIYRAGDEKDLAKKIDWVIANPTLAKTIVRDAKKYVCETFDLEKFMDRIVKEFIKPNVPANC